MIETLTTGPTSEPINVADVKKQLNITYSDDDGYLLNLISAARRYYENYTSRALHDQTWTQYRDGFATEMRLWRHPILDVTSVKYIDENGTQQTLGSSKYRVDTQNARITEAYNETWPTPRHVTNSVEIAYRAGYVDTAASPDTGSIPEQSRQALLILVAHWYSTGREMTSDMRVEDVPLTFHALADQLRVYAI